MRRLLVATLAIALVAGPAVGADKEFFSPDSEEAGWLWPAAFSLYAAYTVAVELPARYAVDTPSVVSALLGRRDSDTLEELVADLRDPYLTVKGPIAAELRRQTGQDFGYSDSAPFLERQRSVAKWAKWVRENPAR